MILFEYKELHKNTDCIEFKNKIIVVKYLHSISPINKLLISIDPNDKNFV